MAKYNYNVEMEAFKRNDNRGKPLYVNVSEAQRIVSMLDLGYSVSDICGKVSLNSPKASVTTIKSFIRNYNDGNIIIPTDAPAPALVFDSVEDDVRLNDLEERVSTLEHQVSIIAESFEKSCDCRCGEKRSITDKVKSWIK